SATAMRSARPGRASALDGIVSGFLENMVFLQVSAGGAEHSGRVPRPAASSQVVAGTAANLKTANIAPCGSLTIAKRPVFGMSVGGTITLPPSSFTRSTLLSASSTWKYGIQ